MRYIFLFLILAASACTTEETTSEKNPIEIEEPDKNPALKELEENERSKVTDRKKYSNERFRDVKVERIGDERFRISGEAQIFEANFGWVIEDGHHELEQGYEMTDAGAPEWGDFDFEVNAEKARENSTLTLVLFETSAKDGSRQHELPVPLY